MRRASPRPLVLLTLLAAAPAFAWEPDPDFVPLTETGELPRLLTDAEGGEAALPLEHTAVRARVTGHVARVEVVQRYGNPRERPIEAVYVFPLPENAAVDDFKLVVGERSIEGVMQPREEARRTYQAARRAGHTAALLEQERPNVFTQSVTNLPPGETVEVVIRYVQTLTYDAGTYEFVFPMVVGPRYVPGTPTGRSGTGTRCDTDRVPDASRISPPYLPAGLRSGHDVLLDLEIEAGLPIRQVEAPTHEVDMVSDDPLLAVRLAPRDTVPNRDFVFRWKVAGEAPQATVLTHKSSRGGFFTLVLQPPDLDVDGLVGRRELIFVVDVSGSMRGLPLWLAKEAMREALSRLRPVDTFDVLTFAGSTRRAFGTPRKATPENLAEALAVVDGLRAGGGTELRGAVDAALSPPTEDGRHRYVVFLTDGYVGNEAEILAATRHFVNGAEGRSRARVFGIGIGSSVNRYLIDGLGEQGRGVSRYVTNREDPLDAVERIFAVVDHPILEDVKLDFGRLKVRDLQPARAPDLFLTRPLVFHGRYDGGGRGRVVLTAKAPSGRPVRLPLKVELPEEQPANGALASLWAREKVRSLTAAAWDGAEVREEITRLGVDFRIMTPYTAFVAVDRSRKVGDGDPELVVQPVEAPEDVDLAAAGGRVAGDAGGLVGNLAVRRNEALFGKKADVRAAPAPSGPRIGGYGAGGAGAVASGSGRGGLAAGDAMGAGGLGSRGLAPGAGGRTLGVGGIGTRGMGRGAGGGGTASPGRPTVDLGGGKGAAVTGSLARGEIAKVVRTRRKQIERCYERALKRRPGLSGRLTVRFVIGADGAVTEAKAQGSTVGDRSLVRCIVSRVRAWRFPKPAGGGVVKVAYPFAFSPAAQSGQPDPQATTSKVTVTGGLEKAVVARVLRRYGNEVRGCYRRTLVQHPGLSGRLEASWRVGARGQVTDARLDGSTVGSPDLEACLLTRIRRWRFPTPAGVGVAEVRCEWTLR